MRYAGIFRLLFLNGSCAGFLLKTGGPAGYGFFLVYRGTVRYNMRETNHFNQKRRTGNGGLTRLSTVKDCDRILVLDGGKIAEEGTYDELIAKGGLFRELVRRQQPDEAEER